MGPFRRESFSDQKAHYESLVSLFKYIVSIVSAVLTIIAIAVGFMIFNDGREMRASMREQEQLVQNHINELNKKEIEMYERILDLMKSTREDVSKTGDRAISQINEIKSESIDIARVEAKKSIDHVFDENNIDDFIVQVAKEKLEPQIERIVNDEILKLQHAKLKKALEDLNSDNTSRHELAFSYFQNADASDWSDDQLRLIVNAMRTTNPRSEYLWDICIYIGLARSPIIEEFFKEELAERPMGEIGRFALHYLLKLGDPMLLKVYFKGYKNISLGKRKSFYGDIITSAISIEQTLLFLNDRQFVDLLFADNALPGFSAERPGNIRQIVEDGLQYHGRLSDETKVTYFFQKFNK